MLLPPLYYLFPLTVHALDENGICSTSSNLSNWIDGALDKRELSAEDFNPDCFFPCDDLEDKIKPLTLVVLADKLQADEATLRSALASEHPLESLGEVKERLNGFLNRLVAIIRPAAGGTAAGAGGGIYRTVKGAEGADLLVVWRGKSAESRPKIHVAAVELKDQRATPSEEWQKKWQSLLSPRCLIWWIKRLYADEFDLEFHIVFAGREHYIAKSDAITDVVEGVKG